MRWMKRLTAHLQSLGLTDHDCFDAWIEKGTLEYSGATVVNGGGDPVNLFLRVPNLVVLSWENWHGNADELFFQVVKWLVENNYNFDLFGMPEFSAVVPDDDVADVQITIHFEDRIYESNGVRVDEPEVTVVNGLSVNLV